MRPHCPLSAEHWPCRVARDQRPREACRAQKMRSLRRCCRTAPPSAPGTLSRPCPSSRPIPRCLLSPAPPSARMAGWRWSHACKHSPAPSPTRLPGMAMLQGLLLHFDPGPSGCSLLCSLRQPSGSSGLSLFTAPHLSCPSGSHLPSCCTLPTRPAYLGSESF